ncbi:MAG: hypothetical protein ACX93N_02690 [Pseudohaliea sp.]
MQASIEQELPERLALRARRLDDALEALGGASRVTHGAKVPRVLDAARQVLAEEGGLALLRERIAALDAAGVFRGSDWDHPEQLVPALARQALHSPDPATVVIEVLSELRFLAIAEGSYAQPSVSPDAAHSHLVRVVALNLSILFGLVGEAERQQDARLGAIARQVIAYVVDQLGFDQVIDELIAEIWRILEQRPIQVEPVREMITQIARCLQDPSIDLGGSGRGAERLVSSLFGPTRACSEDPGIAVYGERLAAMDAVTLQGEVMGLARSMHDTGLVSPYHAVAVRHLLASGQGTLLPDVLGLSSTGRDCLLCYQGLVHALVEAAIHPQSCQALYGLALLLERGILYQPPVAPALWRQLRLVLSPAARERLLQVYGDQPPPEQRLLAGVLAVLGQPLGIGQGNNPTCQSARALSMWSYSDPDYLLQMVAWAARDDEIIMHFEGQGISSRAGAPPAVPVLGFDLDPVSLLVVPHLDLIYAQMMQRCVGRQEDPHCWVNPEFHGWWAGRGFRINVDVATGKLAALEDFLRHFFASYHPYYNGNQPLIHPQPAGIAVTDSAARFVGWHAITILRVALDQDEVMRVYFFNPNNDSGQDWGDGVVVSTAGHGERYGESSLPFVEFASRLYIFHFDPLEPGAPESVEESVVAGCAERVRGSWAADRIPELAAQALPPP